MSKKKIAVLFGGQSSEHVVSCVSAANVIDQINKEKYDLLLIGITEEGHWVKAESVEDIRSGAWRESSVEVVISPDATKKCALITENGVTREERIDVAFRRGRYCSGPVRAGKDPVCRLWCAGFRGIHG